jgi:hypothetical protein
MQASKPILLGKRTASKSAAKKLAPLNTEAIKNKDLLEVQLSPAAHTFSKADLVFEAQQKISSKVYSNSTTNFSNSNNEAPQALINKSKTKLRFIDHVA